MTDVFTVAFFGHRYLDNPIAVQELLEKIIQKLIREKAFVDFLVGRNGDFDQCASSAVLHVRKYCRDDNSALVLVLPYLTADYRNNEEAFHDYYTDVEISQVASQAHPKAAIGIRNREMVERADLILCYLEEPYGGASQAVKYAHKTGKQVINIATVESYVFDDQIFQNYEQSFKFPLPS